MPDELKTCPACGSPMELSDKYSDVPDHPWIALCSNIGCPWRTAPCKDKRTAMLACNSRPLEGKKNQDVSLSTNDRSYTIVLPKPEEQIVRRVVKEVLEEKQKAQEALDLYMRTAERVGIKNPEQYLKSDLHEGLDEFNARLKREERQLKQELAEAEMTKPTPTCGNCRFHGEPVDAMNNTTCQRNPPSVWDPKTCRYVYPMVDARKPCGEHEYSGERFTIEGDPFTQSQREKLMSRAVRGEDFMAAERDR